jgi:hypothetical protein
MFALILSGLSYLLNVSARLKNERASAEKRLAVMNILRFIINDLTYIG